MKSCNGSNIILEYSLLFNKILLSLYALSILKILVIFPILFILSTAFHIINEHTKIEDIVINLLVKNYFPSKLNGRLYLDFGIILPKISNNLSNSLMQIFFLLLLYLSDS